MTDAKAQEHSGRMTARFGHPILMALALIASSTLPAPARAQAASQATPAIVVDGHKLSTREAVRHLTAAVSVEANGQLARFSDAACPSLAGLPAEYGEVVLERIRADATAAGVAVGKPGCQANIVILFVDSGQDIVKQIRQANPSAFGNLSSSDVRRMANDSGPVHAWTATEIRSEDDTPEHMSATGGTSLDRHPTLDVHTASIMYPSTQQTITGSILLLDIKAVLGKTLNQLADYAAMRTLAQTSSRRTDASQDTILTLFSAGNATPPRSLTPFDRGYLKSLYSGPGMRTYFQKLGSIASTINHAAIPPAAPASAADPNGH